MKSDNVLQEKSFAFAVKIVLFTRKLEEDRDYVLAKQLLRSGTAVGALTEESIGGQSLRDFLHKLSIAYKEARETKYWLRLISETNPKWKTVIMPLLKDIEELLRIIGSIQVAVKRKLNDKNQ